jgi:hypothetical protein
MAKVMTLTGLAAMKMKKEKCTPIQVFSKVLNAYVTLCAEDIPRDMPVAKRGRGRPRGSKSRRKGGTAKYPAAPMCSPKHRKWVVIKRFGKNELRCRCELPGKGGNRRYLKNKECSDIPKPNI